MAATLFRGDIELDLNSTASVAPVNTESTFGFDVKQFTEVSVELDYIESPASPTTWVVSIEWSVNGRTWHAFSTPKTINNTTMYLLSQDISGIAYIRLRTTTAQGAACRARATLFASRNID